MSKHLGWLVMIGYNRGFILYTAILSGLWMFIWDYGFTHGIAKKTNQYNGWVFFPWQKSVSSPGLLGIMQRLGCCSTSSLWVASLRIAAEKNLPTRSNSPQTTTSDWALIHCLNLCWIQSLALSLPGIDWIILFLAADSDAQGVHRLSKTAGKPSCIQVMTAIFRPWLPGKCLNQMSIVFFLRRWNLDKRELHDMLRRQDCVGWAASGWLLPVQSANLRRCSRRCFFYMCLRAGYLPHRVGPRTHCVGTLS